MLDQVQQRVRAHDRYQIEFKLDYELLPRPHTRYRITTYIFIPHNLSINNSTYTKAEFYRDLQNYVRLKTPSFSLQEILTASTSPLVHIDQILREPGWHEMPANTERLVNSFKFLRAILKSTLRNHLRTMKRRAKRDTDHQVRAERIKGAVNELLDKTLSIIQRYRAYAAQLKQTDGNPRILRSYRRTDESISLMMEERLVDAFQVVESHVQTDIQAELKAKITKTLEAELSYRRNARYSSVLEAAGDNEAFLYRISLLKKFTSSVLYLALVVKPEGTAIEQVLYAFAAGLSMAFATIIAFYFQNRFGNLTLPFFVALVVGYMFKDRIKELGRLFFAQHLQTYLYDHRSLIHTLDGLHQLGFLREKVHFMPETKLPPAVADLRDRGVLSDAYDGQAENIICYTKEVVLETDVFKQIYPDGPPIHGINDIMRFDVRPYLRKMDDPVERRLYLQDGQLHLAECAKVYYINFVTVYTLDEAQSSVRLERTLLTLTRDGIKRVERVHPQQTADASAAQT
ncbi:MAG: hypothetical protein U0350_06935 [Caldilineaceae bacterium]